MSKKRPGPSAPVIKVDVAPGGDIVPAPTPAPKLTRISWPISMATGFGASDWERGRGDLGDYDCERKGDTFVIRHPETGHELHVPAAQCLAEYSERPRPKMRIPTMADAIAEKEARAAEAAKGSA